MSNPIFQAMGGGKGPQGGPMNFAQFMQQMRGKDPNQMINDLVSSGKLNQSQLNQAQQVAKQFGSRFDGFKSMFGF